MAGAYCNFCRERCFVLRKLPDGSWHGHLATCPQGAAHDRKSTGGYDYRTSINPAEPRSCEKCSRNPPVYPGLPVDGRGTFDKTRFCNDCISRCVDHYDPHHTCVICQ